MVQALLGLPEPPAPDHAADALAVAICHANHAPRARTRGAGGVIALVAGEVAVRRPDHVVVATAAASATGSRSRPRRCVTCRPSGEPVSLHAHLIVRDDALALYGFATEEERDLFLAAHRRAVASAPRSRSPCSRAAAPRELVGALAAGDSARFQAVPGIGKRTAERIIVELREKVGGAGDEAPGIAITRGDDPRTLARDGLLGLGFAPAEARRCSTEAEGDTRRGADRRRAAAARR